MRARFQRLFSVLNALPARVALLVLLLLLPMVALSAYLAHMMGQSALAQLEAEALTLARSVAGYQGATFVQAKRHLNALAASIDVDSPAAWCEENLGPTIQRQPIFYQIGYLTEDGAVVCAARPIAAGLVLRDRDYFAQVVDSKAFVLSNLLKTRGDGRWTLIAAQPVLDGPQDLHGVLIGAMDFRWIQQGLANLRLPKGSVVSLTDGNGLVMARFPEPDHFIGKAVSEEEDFMRRMRGQTEGVMNSAGIDGVARIVAYSQIPDTQFYARVGIPRAQADALRQHALNAALGVAAAVIGFAMLVGWFGARRLILQPLQRLTDAARHLGTGDWTARTGLVHRSDAMGQLAEKLDALAEHGQRTSRAFRTLSGGNRTLLRESDEPRLLKEMCRVAVEQGGYALAFVNYAQHDAEKSIRVVAHHGVNEGFLENLNMTWSNTERGQSSISQAIRYGGHCIIRNITSDTRVRLWHEALTRRGFGAAISLPLRVDDQVIGAFTLLTSEANAFDDDEVHLLDEMAADLSFGIANIRARARQLQTEQMAERLLTYDHPTNLPNRTLFLKGLTDAIAGAAAGGHSIAVLVVQLARLQEIVDGFGYEPGQGVIREMAARLARADVITGTLARLEVAEFGVYLDHCDPGSAARLADSLLAVFNEPALVGSAHIDISATVGVAFYPGHGADAEALVRRAAIAARDGVHRDHSYSIYRGATERENPTRLALAAELRSAIAKNELVLYYQPKIHLGTQSVYGAEALVRWPHATRGLVSPAQFVPLAEETGLIRPMTARLVENAIRQQHLWRREGREVLPIAVNLSVRNLYDPQFLESLQTLLETWGVAANLIDFEITESALVDDPETAKKVLTRLRQLGSKIYIDDFGTGYSSLNYLVTLPVHALKIDQSFVRQMDASPEAHSVVASIISMAHNLGLQVIAEGVETESHRMTLAELGCDSIQGYVISKPLPAADFAKGFLKHDGMPAETIITRT